MLCVSRAAPRAVPARGAAEAGTPVTVGSAVREDDATPPSRVEKHGREGRGPPLPRRGRGEEGEE